MDCDWLADEHPLRSQQGNKQDLEVQESPMSIEALDCLFWAADTFYRETCERIQSIERQLLNAGDRRHSSHCIAQGRSSLCGDDGEATSNMCYLLTLQMGTDRAVLHCV